MPESNARSVPQYLYIYVCEWCVLGHLVFVNTGKKVLLQSLQEPSIIIIDLSYCIITASGQKMGKRG